MTDAQLALANAKASLEPVAAAVGELIATNGMLSLKVDDLSAANVQLQAQVDALRLENAELRKKLEPVPPVVKTVRDYRQAGDADDTAAFQRAANSGSVIVPAGEYLIDAAKRITITLDKTVVRMEAGVVLRAKPNSAARYYIMDVEASDCDIDCGGAEFYGDRLKHNFTAGSSHEWGYGIFMGGARNKLRNVKVYECTGDGIGVTGPGHEITGVVAKRNRRNGLSAFRSAGLWVHDCEFSETGFLTDATGLPGPFAGIDVEPDKGAATGIRIERVKCSRNQKAGIAFWVRDEVTDSKLEGVVSDCVIDGSPNAIWGCDEAVRAPTIAITVLRNRLTFNSGAAVKADQGSRFVVGDANVANANTIDSATGSRTTALTYGIQEKRGGVATKGQNTFV